MAGVRFSRLQIREVKDIAVAQKVFRRGGTLTTQEGICVASIQEWIDVRAELFRDWYQKRGDDGTPDAGMLFCMQHLVAPWVNGEVRNYFIDTPDLMRFLMETPVVDTEALRGVVAECQDNTPGDGHKTLVVAIHHTISDRSILAIIVADPHYTQYGGAVVCVTNGERIGIRYLTPESFRTNNLNNYGNAVANLFLYAATFPDMIHEGVPEGVMLPYQPTRPVTVRTAEEIIDRSGVTPHFRRGHFRMLRSEHWTKKRGQIVFVRSTFVGGHAETVEDAGERREEMVKGDPE